MDDPKVGLRASIGERLRRLPKSSRAARSTRIAALLLESSLWRDSAFLLSFLSLSTEVHTAAINEAALAAGKRLALPRIEGEALSFRAVTSLELPWERNSYRIREPGAALPVVSLEGLAAEASQGLLLVPGLAFDRRGNRLGRGRGFYDRQLAACEALRRPARGVAAGILAPGRRGASGLIAVGLCFNDQIVEEVPVGPLDRRVDLLLTEEGFLAPQALEQEGDHR